jgi:hypothetical protein
MSLLTKITGKAQEDPIALTKQEIEFLLLLIKQSSFQGESLESLYNLVLKLQQQYLSLDK